MGEVVWLEFTAARTHIEGTLRQWRREVQNRGVKQATVLAGEGNADNREVTRAVQVVHSNISLCQSRQDSYLINVPIVTVDRLCFGAIYQIHLVINHLNSLVTLLSQRVKLTDVTSYTAVLPSPYANTTSHSLR
jgi:hypothetical protein